MWATPLHLHATARRPGALERLAARLHVWLSRARLDRELARGADPDATPALKLRAAQLTSTRRRASLARALQHLLDTDARRPWTLSAAVPPHLGEVRTARPELEALILKLRSAGDVSPREMASLRALLTDGDGPLYRPAEHGALARELRTVAGPVEHRLGGL
jgi:hypothetical protein